MHGLVECHGGGFLRCGGLSGEDRTQQRTGQEHTQEFLGERDLHDFFLSNGCHNTSVKLVALERVVLNDLLVQIL